MLDPWALKQSRWKKSIASFAYQRRVLAAAHCIHVLNEAELEAVRKYGLKVPVCVIPNGVTLPEAEKSFAQSKANRGRTLLYLGRLHAKKNLINAITAFALAARSYPQWSFDIVGWPLETHYEELKAHAEGLGIGDRVIFRGPLYGAEKEAILASADAFILASHSEGMPMAVLEAWAHGLPVLMTRMCNLDEGFQYGAALEVGTDAASIALAMEQLFAGSEDKRRAVGSRGRDLVVSEFSWDRIARRFEAVYRWVSGNGSRPEDVRT
jgi:poly(glycerol-phosphate) alpha-glucosyltransferase